MGCSFNGPSNVKSVNISKAYDVWFLRYWPLNFILTTGFMLLSMFVNFLWAVYLFPPSPHYKFPPTRYSSWVQPIYDGFQTSFKLSIHMIYVFIHIIYTYIIYAFSNKQFTESYICRLLISVSCVKLTARYKVTYLLIWINLLAVFVVNAILENVTVVTFYLFDFEVFSMKFMHKNIFNV